MTVTGRLRFAGKLLAALLACVGLVAGSAVWAWRQLPAWLLAEALPRISALTTGRIEADSVELNSSAPHLVVRGLRIEGAEHHPLVSIATASATLDFDALQHERRIVFALRLDEPRIELHRNPQGRWNWTGWLKPSNSPSGPVPATLTRLNIEGGQLAFADEATAKPIKTALHSVEAELGSFRIDKLSAIPVRVSAKGTDEESLSAAGVVDPRALSLKIHGEIQQLPLDVWWDRLGISGDWRIPAGRLDGVAEVAARFQPDLKLEISQARARAEGLEIQATAPGGPALAVERFLLADMEWNSGGDVRIGRMDAEKLRLGDMAGANPDGAKLRKDRRESSESLMQTRLHVGRLAGKALTYEMKNQRFRAKEISLKNMGAEDFLGESPPVAGNFAKSLEVRDLLCDLPQRAVSLGGISGEGGGLSLKRDRQGRLSLDRVALPGPGGTQPDAQPAKPWSLRFDSFYLAGYAVDFLDETVKPATPLHLNDALLSIGEFRSDSSDLPIAFALATELETHGMVRASGRAFLNPLFVDGEIDLDQVDLQSFQAYLNPLLGLELRRGRIDLGGMLSYWQAEWPTVRLQGDVELADWTTADRAEGRDFVRWGSLRLEGLSLDSTAKRLGIRQIKVDEPFARVVIGSDGRLNFPPDSTPTTGAEKPGVEPSSPWSVVVGAVRVARGRLDFADLSLKPGFNADIHDLYGRIRGLTSLPDARADVALDGRINHSATVNVSGQVNPFRFKHFTDIGMRFRGLNLTTLSPYSSRFAGHRIEKGKVDMDLRYTLKNGQLSAQNRMVLDRLELGEKVESSTATNLPVRLAVALLKDSSGRIDLDLPVSGNLDAPEVSFKGLLGSAVGQLIGKVVGSPFSVLGNLAQSGPEDFGSIRFAPGLAFLSPEEKAKLEKIAMVLKERPELSLDVKGSADGERDRQALAEQALAAELGLTVEVEGQGSTAAALAGQNLADPKFRAALAQLYGKRRPNSAESGQLAAAVEKAEETGLFERALSALLAERQIGEIELRRLAQARGERIFNYLVREKGLPERRIYLLDVKLAAPGEAELGSSLRLSGG